VAQEYLDTEETARLVRRPPETLRYWRSRGVGPKWIKPPGTRHILYRRADVDEWLAAGEREAATA
jgi:hypothetical protein